MRVLSWSLWSRESLSGDVRFANCLSSRKVLDIRDIRLDWRPILRAMQDDLFPTFRNTGRNGSLSPLLINIAEACQRFFHPSDIDEMLEEILPRMNGADMDVSSSLTLRLVLTSSVDSGHPSVPLQFPSHRSPPKVASIDFQYVDGHTQRFLG